MITLRFEKMREFESTNSAWTYIRKQYKLTSKGPAEVHLPGYDQF